MNEINKDALKTYNHLMADLGYEHNTIGTNLSEDTEDWNLRDMVSEAQYTLDMFNDPNSIHYADAHDQFQPAGKPWYKQWINEKARLKRFIEKYEDEAMEMECSTGHCSCYD